MDLIATVAIKNLLRHTIQATQPSKNYLYSGFTQPTGPPQNQNQILAHVGGHFKTDIWTHLKIIFKNLFLPWDSG